MLETYRILTIYGHQTATTKHYTLNKSWYFILIKAFTAGTITVNLLLWQHIKCLIKNNFWYWSSENITIMYQTFLNSGNNFTITLFIRKIYNMFVTYLILSRILHARTFCDHWMVTAFVDHTCADCNRYTQNGELQHFNDSWSSTWRLKNLYRARTHAHTKNQWSMLLAAVLKIHKIIKGHILWAPVFWGLECSDSLGTDWPRMDKLFNTKYK